MSSKTRFSRRNLLAVGIVALASIVLAGLLPAGARAQSLDAVRSAGTVGERYDGYLVLRDGGASGAVKSLVTKTNAQRKALYEKRAKEEKAPVAAIGKIYAGQIMKKAPKGTYFLSESGKWTRK
jgi:uncharacterized protein YdbL (DUF1318 family)